MGVKLNYYFFFSMWKVLDMFMFHSRAWEGMASLCHVHQFPFSNRDYRNSCLDPSEIYILVVIKTMASHSTKIKR